MRLAIIACANGLGHVRRVISITAFMLKNGYHFLSNNILPEKMKPDKLEKMTKTLSTPNIDSLIMIPCQNYDGNNNNKNKNWQEYV